MVSLALERTAQNKERLLLAVFRLGFIPIHDISRICVTYAYDPYEDFERYLYEAYWDRQLTLHSFASQIQYSVHYLAQRFRLEIIRYTNRELFIDKLAWALEPVSSTRCHRPRCFTQMSCTCSDWLHPHHRGII